MVRGSEGEAPGSSVPCCTQLEKAVPCSLTLATELDAFLPPGCSRVTQMYLPTHVVQEKVCKMG